MVEKTADLVFNAVHAIVEENGCELYEVDFTKKNTGMNLTLFIDKPEGITIDDCERVHNAVNDTIDALEINNGKAYILNVSSLGLDRQLKTTKDFNRVLNKELEVSLFKKVEGEKQFLGTLIGVDEQYIELETNNEVIKFERSNIAKANLKLDF